VDGANRNSEFANQDLPSPAKSGRLRGLSPSHPLFQPLNGIYLSFGVEKQSFSVITRILESSRIGSERHILLFAKTMNRG